MRTGIFATTNDTRNTDNAWLDEPQPWLVKKSIGERGRYDCENVLGGTPFPNGYLKIGGTEYGSIDRLSTFACDD